MSKEGEQFFYYWETEIQLTFAGNGLSYYPVAVAVVLEAWPIYPVVIYDKFGSDFWCVKKHYKISLARSFINGSYLMF
jgi:hypothetical protein